VAESDMMAIGVLRALHEHGLRVPQDVSVTGFDDIDLAAYTLPSLTTVRQDTEAMGGGAVKALLEFVGGEPHKNGGPSTNGGPRKNGGPGGPGKTGRAPEPLRPPTELVVRHSTAPPRITDR